MLKKKKIGFFELLDSTMGGKFLDECCGREFKKREFERWYKQTGEAGEIFPSQGLLKTPCDYLEYLGKTLMGEEELWGVVRVRRLMLELFNHPERIAVMEKLEARPFVPPSKVTSSIMDYTSNNGEAVALGDVGAVVIGTDKPRRSRRKLLLAGTFVTLGKKVRIPFASGAMPDVFGAPAALSTMAMCHGLAGVPRNGVFSEVVRQVDLVVATFEFMRTEALLAGRSDARALLKRWRANIMGVVEPELLTGLARVRALYEVGVRCFRIYSPEPGTGVLEMVKKMRGVYGDRIEIFAGQVASVDQAKRLEEAGADGLYVGIGGGGRCITAVRSGSVVDWPNLLWRMRGEVGIPVIVEGGASEHVGTTLLLGATGIGVSRIAAGGTIESPGGLLYLVNRAGEWFKPYGGEASARTKYQDGKMLPLGVPAFVEGETTKALKSFITHVKPTVAANIYFLLEDLVLAMVFRGVATVQELQALDPSPLRRVTDSGQVAQRTH